MTDLSTPVTEFLKANSGYYRIEREWGPVMPPNTWIYSRLYFPSGYDPLAILSYSRWYSGCQSNGLNLPETSFTRYVEGDKYNFPCIDLFGVKYLVAIKRNEKGDYDQEGEYLNRNISTDKFKRVFTDGSLVILENKSVLPRIMLYGKYLVEQDPKKAQEKILRQLDFRKEIVINREPIFSNHAVYDNDSAEIVKYLPNEVTVSTNTIQPAFLLLTDTYYPGWKVYLDNIEFPLMVADGIYRAIEVPEGKHMIVFKYDPNSFKIGMVSSIVSCFILLLLILYEKRYQKTSR
jgi:hypothetical protein